MLIMTCFWFLPKSKTNMPIHRFILSSLLCCCFSTSARRFCLSTKINHWWRFPSWNIILHQKYNNYMPILAFSLQINEMKNDNLMLYSFFSSLFFHFELKALVGFTFNDAKFFEFSLPVPSTIGNGQLNPFIFASFFVQQKERISRHVGVQFKSFWGVCCWKCLKSLDLLRTIVIDNYGSWFLSIVS